LSKSLELVRVKQDPLGVFVSVQSHRRFQFQKRSQLFIGTHDETFSIAVSLRPQSRVIDAFTRPGAEAIVSVTTLLGLSQVLLALRVAGRYSLPVSGEAHPVIIK